MVHRHEEMVAIKTGQFVITATRDVFAGEQLFIDYDVPRAPVNQRRAWLEIKYKFTCHCQACEGARIG
jgi:SET domain-containing protein